MSRRPDRLMTNKPIGYDYRLVSCVSIFFVVREKMFEIFGIFLNPYFLNYIPYANCSVFGNPWEKNIN